MGVGLVEVAGDGEGPGRTASETLFKGGAALAFSRRLLVTHPLKNRRIVPEGIKIVPQNIADHQRDETTGGEVAVRPQM